MDIFLTEQLDSRVDGRKPRAGRGSQEQAWGYRPKPVYRMIEKRISDDTRVYSTIQYHVCRQCPYAVDCVRSLSMAGCVKKVVGCIVERGEGEYSKRVLYLGGTVQSQSVDEVPSLQTALSSTVQYSIQTLLARSGFTLRLTAVSELAIKYTVVSRRSHNTKVWLAGHPRVRFGKSTRKSLGFSHFPITTIHRLWCSAICFNT